MPISASSGRYYPLPDLEFFYVEILFKGVTFGRTVIGARNFVRHLVEEGHLYPDSQLVRIASMGGNDGWVPGEIGPDPCTGEGARVFWTSEGWV